MIMSCKDMLKRSKKIFLFKKKNITLTFPYDFVQKEKNITLNFPCGAIYNFEFINSKLNHSKYNNFSHLICFKKPEYI